MNTMKQQSDLKYHNRMKVYRQICDCGPISRAQLAKLTGLSATSMTRMIAGLTELGMVRESAQRSLSSDAHGMGRPSVMLETCADKAYSLNVDLEASCLRAALMDLAHHFVVYRELSIAPKGDSFSDVALKIQAVFLEMLQQARIAKEEIKCCGLTLGAHVDVAGERIIASSQFRWYEEDAAKELGELLQMPVIVENDCKAALYGERFLLAAKEEPLNHLAYLELGTDGVGGAVIVDGRLLRGSRNAAGEIGHITVLPEGEICNCGRRGCFETVLTEKFILKRAQAINAGCQTIDDVMDAMRREDARIVPLMEELGDYIAIAINDISCAYNPEMVILNGPVIQKNATSLSYVRRHLANRLMKSVQPHLIVDVARMGANASLYGIGCLATEKIIAGLLRG